MIEPLITLKNTIVLISSFSVLSVPSMVIIEPLITLKNTDVHIYFFSVLSVFSVVNKKRRPRYRRRLFQYQG